MSTDKILETAKTMAAHGETYEKIAKKLNSMGAKTKIGSSFRKGRFTKLPKKPNGRLLAASADLLAAAQEVLVILERQLLAYNDPGERAKRLLRRAIRKAGGK